MIIVDQGANIKLIQALKNLDGLEQMYCLRIFPVEGNQEYVHRTIITRAQNYFSDADLYACDDGEIFLLMQAESLKECKRAAFAIATALKIFPAENVGEIYEVPLQSNLLLISLEKKVTQHRIEEEVAAKQRAQKQAAAYAAQKRQEILSQGAHKTAEQIAAQRGLRSEPMLMIIEDDPFSRRLVENALQKQYRLTGLDSAEGALSTYAEIAPDLLFLDINLPDVTGHELLEKIMALDPKAYVIMLSGNADRANVLQAIERGAAGFVAKPFSRDRLFQYIDRCPTLTKEKVQ